MHPELITKVIRPVECEFYRPDSNKVNISFKLNSSCFLNVLYVVLY